MFYFFIKHQGSLTIVHQTTGKVFLKEMECIPIYCVVSGHDLNVHTSGIVLIPLSEEIRQLYGFTNLECTGVLYLHNGIPALLRQ